MSEKNVLKGECGEGLVFLVDVSNVLYVGRKNLVQKRRYRLEAT